MTTIDRHRVAWTGFVGSPGLSTFYCTTGVDINTALHTFFDTIKTAFPLDVRITVEPAGDSLDSTTGALVGSWAGAVTAPVQGTSSTNYSAISGALMRWVTNTFLSGRRLRGHTFLIPLGGGEYDASGQVNSSRVAALGAAATTMITALGADLLVWQRPRVAAAAYTDRRGVVHPAITARGGGFGPVLTGSARPEVTELKSRRD
jgi:hypothetical protein